MQLKVEGFTLVEVAVVLVMIGLIVAGLTAAQTLVQQSRLRAIMSDLKEYQAAIQTFKLTYGALPGDITNFYDYFASCASSSEANCDGDGDGIVDDPSETRPAWEHLSLAGLISGGYTYGTTLTIGKVVPSAGFNDGGYRISETPSQYVMSGGSKVTVASNCIRVAAGSSYTVGTTGMFTPTQASSIDRKIDDGEALLGGFQVRTGSSGCVTGSDAYDLDSTTTGCYAASYIP